MSTVNFPWITRPILYMEIRRHSQWLQWVDKQPATIELSASGSWHSTMLEHSSAAAVTSCVKHCGVWTLNWLPIYCKSENSGLFLCHECGSNANTHCWLHHMPNPRPAVSKVYMAILLSATASENVSSVCGQLTACKRNRLTFKSWESQGF